jgi:hypothetical protein
MILLLPAYGRTYDTVEAMEADWNAGKDFRILKGPYCSNRDFELLKGMGHDVVLICGNIRKFIQKGNENGHGAV